MSSETFDSLLRQVAAPPSVSSPREFKGTARFHLGRRLGQGAFGTVFEAFDTQTHSRVALKALRHRHEGWAAQFKREFRSLADVSHPNVVRFQELERHDDQWFFTMELVEGVSLLDGLRAGRVTLDDAFEQLLSGVEALHAAGVLHGDLKPSNVLVAPEGRVVIVDFGLAEHVDPLTRLARPEGGTPQYMAPEQLSGEAVGFAADWYAVGVMLFEALTGRAPFSATSTQALLAARRAHDAPSVHALVPDAPPRWAELCARLLQRAPDARPRLSTGEQFIGRDAEQRRLADFFASAATPAVFVLAGPSGAGKTALVTHFLSTVRASTGAQVLTGRCFEQEAVPFKALDGLVDELSRRLSRLDDEARAEFVHDAGPLAVLFPVLRRVPGVRPTSDVPDEGLRRRAFDALRRLMTRLGASQPVWCSIDDLQWSDADSVPVLVELLSVGVPLRLVVTVRDDLGSPALSAFLDHVRERAASGQLHLAEEALGPLSSDDALALARAQLPAETPQPVLKRVCSDSGGLPFFLRAATRWAGEAPPASLEDLVLQQVAALSAEARQLLEVLAVAGRPLPPSVARSSAGSGPLYAAAVAQLRGERLTRSQAGALEPYHDRIRAMVLGRLAPTRRASHHLALAVALSAAGADDAQLALHFHEGGDDARAFPHAVQAALAAERTLAFAVAAGHYEQALAWQPAQATPPREVLLEGRARALLRAGRGADAGPLFLALARGQPDRALALKTEGVDALLVAGAVDEGLAGARELAREAGVPWPSSPVGAALASLAALGRAGVRAWWPGLLPRRRAAPEADVAATIFRGLLPVAPTHAGFFAVTELDLALAVADPRRTSLALARVGSGLFGPGPGWMAGAGERMVGHAKALAAPLAEPHLEGALEIAAGACAFWDGHWARSLERCERGVRGLQRDGTATHERNLAHVMMVRCLEELGRWNAARELNDEFSRDAEGRGDLYATVTAGLNHGFAALVTGHSAFAREHVARVLQRWPLGLDSLQHVYGLRVRLLSLLFEGRAAEAWRELEAAWPAIRRGMHLAVRPGAVDLLHLRARVALAAGEVKVARACVAGLAGVARDDAQAHAALVRAGVAGLDGDAWLAARHLGDAEARYLALGMKTGALVASHWRARLGGGDGEAQLAALAADGCRAARWACVYAPGLDSWLAQHAR